MYAGTIVNWIDQSGVSQETNTVSSSAVRYWCFITSDKGPEDTKTVYGSEFFKLYGNPSFEKHGQPAIQASEIASAGGILTVKRLVAEDATLANIVICAKVTTTEREKETTDGQPIYIDKSTGKETTEAGDGNERAKYTVASVKHVINTIADAKSYDDVITGAEKLLDDSEGMYPLFAFVDIGRGKSSKKVKFLPDYAVSKNSKYMIYTIAEIENTTTVESTTCTINPDIVIGDKAYGLSKSTIDQLDCNAFSTSIGKYIDRLAEATGFGADYLYTQDFLFGRTVKNGKLENVEIDDTGARLDAEYGIELQSGSNGAFGDAPFGSAAYTKVATDYLTGVTSDEIYDFTAVSPDVIFDANYPDKIKRAIEELANYRQDFFFFEDLGLGLCTYEAIAAKASDCTGRSKFSALYCTSYDIYDPATKKPIEVTMMYGMAPLMIPFFTGGRHRPLCGPANSMAITNYIPGSVRFSPRITPKVNQKSLLEDIRVNYAMKVDASVEQLVIETCYTSQEEMTQASYINNILIIQMVVKAIRAYSPKVRYRFYTGNDFSDYKAIIEDNVLSAYKSYFNTLELVYTQDDLLAQKKIFKASLRCACGNFIQTEMYDVMIIDAE